MSVRKKTVVVGGKSYNYEYNKKTENGRPRKTYPIEVKKNIKKDLLAGYKVAYIKNKNHVSLAIVKDIEAKLMRKGKISRSV